MSDKSPPATMTGTVIIKGSIIGQLQAAIIKAALASRRKDEKK